MSQIPPAKATGGAGDPSPWHRLRLMARPRATKANVFAALLTIILGFAMATQVRQNQVLGLESLRQGELVTILDNATLQSSRLEQSARELFDLVTSGKVKIEVKQRFALKDAAKAHRELEGRRTSGSTILTI